MTPRNSKQWIPHPLDAVDHKALRKKTIEKGVYLDMNDKLNRAETEKRRKKLGKLGHIVRLEHELSGEEDW